MVGLWGYGWLDGFIAERHSTSLGAIETFLEMGLGAPGIGPELTRLLAETPAGRDVALFTSELDQTSSVLSQSASYLVWPRRLILTVLSGTDRANAVSKVVASRPSAILFYRLSVPFQGGTKLGPKLIYFRLP